MEELTKQVEKLTDQRDMVQHAVNEAKRQGDEIEKKVEKWMHSVDEFTNGVVKPIIDDQVKAGKLCSIGFCPNLMARYSLSRKAAKTTEKGVHLLGEGMFEKVSYRPLLQKTTSIYDRGYEHFDSRNQVFNDLMKALTEAKFSLIGVYGMGGVGKTTLVKRVIAQAIEDKLFDDVVMAEVTETPDIKNIQGQIADKLGLTFQKESLSGRADQLRDRLKKEKRLLLVLDNIWAKLTLEAVGIPLGEEEEKRSSLQADQRGRNEEQRQGKILFTSRNLDVLRDDMNTQKNFFVEILSVEEAEKLFWKHAGHPEEKPDLNPIAVKIVEKCAGLPVAIATIASALKNKSLSVWKNALEQLRMSNPRNIPGMDANVYSTIKLSYNFLESEEAKSLFLLCGAVSATGSKFITDLFKYAMGWGLFQDVYTMEQGRNRLHTLIEILKASCLLLDYGDNDQIKMHDIIHNVAISIASTDKLMFNIQIATGLKEMFEEKLPNDATVVSLPRNDICELPERLELPKLKLLFLHKKDLNPLRISDTFFERVKELRVLDLTNFSLSSLPLSLQFLTNLQTLCLDHCVLGDISSIGYLTKLEVLSLLSSNIEHFPGEIRQLTRLRLLDMTGCIKLKTIAPGVISNLTRLEELYIGDSFVQWDVNGRTNASLTELKQLAHLTALEIQILDAQIMSQDLFSGKLDRYKIFIGDVWDWFGNYSKTSKALRLKWSDIIYLGNGIKSLLNRTEDLYLDELKGVKNVLYELDEEGFPQLKHLHVQNGLEVQDIITSDRLGPSTFFPKLESLFLHNLINLEKICNGQLAIESFSKLRTVKVEKCDRLKHLFSFSMAKNLLQLEEIEVIDCKKLEEIVFNNSDKKFHQNGRTEFTRLRTLRLQCLPQLTSFGFNAFTPEIGSQEILAEDELGGFMPSFSQNVLLPNLEKLKLFSINIECLWLDQLPAMSSCCQTLTSLTLEECSGNLKFLFSYSVVQSLVQLQKLEVRNCKSIEEIINTEELRGEKKMIKMVFPKLINLQLEGLPKLSRFGSGNSVEFLSLTQISIEDCPKLKSFFSDIKKSKEVEEMNFQDDIHFLFDEKVVLPNLASVNLSSIRIKTIWHDQLQPMSSCFQNLKEIIMDGCDTLKYVFPSSMVEGLIQLEVLEISNCKAVEVVTITAGEIISNTWFPKLYRLVLKHLPELTTFCNVAGKSIELTSLADLWLENCPKMLAFVSNSQHADMPAAKEEQKNSEKNLQYSHIQPFFDEKVLLPNLENLKLSSINIECLWLDQLPSMSSCCHTLTNLTLEECSGNLKFLFSYSMVKSLVRLEMLEIRNCKSIEEVINSEELRGEEKGIKMVFPKLINLQLEGLPNLTQFASGNIVEFPSLNQLSIIDCQKLKTFSSALMYPNIKQSKAVEEMNCQDDIHPFFDEKVQLPTLASLELSSIASQTIWHNQLQAHSACFHNLTDLTVDGCDNLKYLFPFSVAESLDNLEVLDIRNCKLMEGVIITREERKSSTLFRKLKQLDLRSLPELTRFCNLNRNSIELPSLSELNIRNCPKMQTFASDSLPDIEETEVVNTETEENLPSFFDEKVRLPNLELLRLDKMDQLKKIWHHQLSSDSFCKLNSLWVNKCHNLLNVIPSNMFGILQKLEELWLTNCNSLYEIFELQASGCGKTQAITATQLEKLVLYDLPKLKHIWDVDSQGLLTCQNLISIQVTGCGSLKSIFPASVGRNLLLQLEELCIENCCMVEEIFAKEEQVDEAVPRFPQLTLLRLAELPRLQSFYPRVRISEWPMLKKLQVWNCDKVEVSASNFLSFQVTHEMPLDQPLLLLDKVPLTNLESLGLDWKWFEKEALHEKLPEYSCNLNFLTIEGFHKGADICVFCFLNKLPNLDTLEVSGGFFKGLFLCEGSGCEEKHVEAPSKLSHLTLVELNDSLHLWEENSLSSKGFQNLAILEVVSCSNLKSLVPSFVSFQNLTRLEVWECNELLNLVAVPTAKSLVQLTELSISECKMVEEIIIHEGDEVKDRIIFKNLRNLDLKCLPSLTSFYSGSCTTVFPYLQQVVVSECPNMKIFSRGVLSTPSLHRLQTTEEEEGKGFWNGNLNTTIENLFIKNGQSYTES